MRPLHRITNEGQLHSSAPPQLSVVVASDHSIREVDQCLKSLLGQRRNEKIEIIVADSRADNSLQAIITKYPDVEFIRFPEETTLPTLWGAGIAGSHGEIIAVTDSTSVVDNHWISAILEAHESSYPVIGGAVEVAERRKLLDWAAYFVEYGQFMQPLKEGRAQALPGNNISFKRWTLMKGPEFVRNGFWKTYWCRQLRDQGIQLVLTPSIVIYDKKSYQPIPFLIRRFQHGRCFAGMRLAKSGFVKRSAYALGSFLLPFIFFTRIVARITPKKRHLAKFFLSLPIIALAIVSWSLGECCGYLSGAGKSCAHVV